MNLFKMITAAARTDRTTIISEAGNFPTDVHVAEGAAKGSGLEFRLVEREAIHDSLDENVALLLLTHVHYKSGCRYDMTHMNAVAAEWGIPVVWDLSHSVGAVRLNLHDSGCQFGVGCGYKYLNGGPGAPAFIYASADQQAKLRPILQGWMGHESPFGFADEYQPAEGMRRFMIGTPPILSMLALETGLSTFEGVEMAQVEAKSAVMFDYFVDTLAEHCPELRLQTPRHVQDRGSHVSFSHLDAWPINNALIARGIVGDFRVPDVLRFGLTPLHTRYSDLADTIDALVEVFRFEEYRMPEFSQQKTVT